MPAAERTSTAKASRGVRARGATAARPMAPARSAAAEWRKRFPDLSEDWPTATKAAEVERYGAAFGRLVTTGLPSVRAFRTWGDQKVIP
jgi:hypothetical protein